ncbi:CcmD family protein [Desulfohalobium retbaense]|uniref:CcmD family protein n=1 Tax=Desulfohalobium retbaense (strain ATCC 49708 / DSM 5692 / JCM 16813 / HR100) TaxID=485915 RepID=C8X1H7_DESRD|nr:CcmD family protein [Desulfohalobium retbaense]ACV68274.1 hypothetical protein Dret_0986 [Desulfohalobium retbaense DSM 5692]
MAAIEYVLAANVAIWAGVSLYLGFLSLQQRRIDMRLHQLERVENEDSYDS